MVIIKSKPTPSLFFLLFLNAARYCLSKESTTPPSLSLLPSCWPEPGVLSSIDSPCWAEQMNSCFHGASKFMRDQQRISKQIRIYKIQRALGEINQIQRQRIRKNLLGKVVKEGSHSWCLMSKGEGCELKLADRPTPDQLWRIRLLFKGHTHTQNPSFKQWNDISLCFQKMTLATMGRTDWILARIDSWKPVRLFLVLEKDTHGLALRDGNGDGENSKMFSVGMNESGEWGKGSCQEWCPGVWLV